MLAAIGVESFMRARSRARCATDAQAVFDDVRTAWRERSLTGRDLYAFAGDAARRRGWMLNARMDGHRLSDFPHHVYYRGGLSTVDAVPSSTLWVLEILIRHPTEPFGAFYEDLLVA